MRIRLALLYLAAASSFAVAEPLEVGGFFGPRRFAPDSLLGASGAADTSLSNTVVVGPRVARPLLSWLVPELELALTPATTRELDVGVFWLEPRALLRLELRPRARLRPFFGLGVGMPTALSSKRGLYESGISVEGLAALGLAWNPGRGLAVRLDARFGVSPARADAARPVAFEGEILLGLYVPLGRRAPATAATVERAPEASDRDDDGVADADDACPDRAEDHDGFEDRDGCPDIDNDLDHVLDIADKCASVAETYNGFDDDDGCPDRVPPEIDAVIGTVEGLLYRDGDTEVRALAAEGLDKLALALTQHPGVRIILVGHTDDQEAVPPPPADGEAAADPPPDVEALAAELGRERAAAVRAALIARGVPASRLVVDSAGASVPVSDNDTPRGRLRNRRVEVRLYVPKPGV